MDGKLQLPLPTLIECDIVPDDRSEIPSPDVAEQHSHLQLVANKIPAVDPDTPILMLLGETSSECIRCVYDTTLAHSPVKKTQAGQ